MSIWKFLQGAGYVKLKVTEMADAPSVLRCMQQNTKMMSGCVRG